MSVVIDFGLDEKNFGGNMTWKSFVVTVSACRLGQRDEGRGEVFSPLMQLFERLIGLDGSYEI